MSPHRNADWTWVSLCDCNRQQGTQEQGILGGYTDGEPHFQYCPRKSKEQMIGISIPGNSAKYFTTGEALRLSDQAETGLHSASLLSVQQAL